jgi:hypothetical protein
MTATPLDLDEQIERIRRSREESDKFVAEQKKLMAEAAKLSAKQAKLYAEGLKLNRDRWIAPVVVAVTMLGALTAAVTSIIMLLRFTP